MPTADLFAEVLPAVHATDSTAFEIGWDYAHYRLTPPPDALAVGHPVRPGWQAGSATFGTRTLKPTAHVRKWLQLRLNAWRRGKPFEGTQVTPNFLAQIDVPVCPITRLPLTHASGAGSDASVDRVCNQAGYAAGNLAVISTRANQAKADLGCRDALDIVQQLEASGLDTLDGLDALQWSRLAVLMSFATPMRHDEAACLPLLVLPPNRLRLLNAVQALQAVVTLAFTQTQAVPRLRELMAQVPAAARHDFQVFVLTLQARRLAIGMQTSGAALRQALEDLWTDAAVNRRWQRFALQLGEVDCERLVRIAAKRGLAGRGWQWLPQAAATEGWALPAAKPPVKQAACRSAAARTIAA
ncbi:MAG TPA: hypothetical protein VFQ20_11180 [Burkholderiaceae bacterium]|nr:hypothetical protein [Burkholderiaceae bacterium]